VLTPEAGELPVVAPLITQVSFVLPSKAQLSDITGAAGTIVVVHVPASTFTLVLAGQLTVGGITSLTVIVKEHDTEINAASLAV
jgi:hypothetical protein